MPVFETFFYNNCYFLIAIVKQGNYVREAVYGNQCAAEKARMFYTLDYRKYELLDMMWRKIDESVELEELCAYISRHNPRLERFSAIGGRRY